MSVLTAACSFPLDQGCPYDEAPITAGSADSSVAAALEAEYAGASRWTLAYLGEEEGWSPEIQAPLVGLGAVELTVTVAGDALRREFEDAACGGEQVVVPIEADVRSDDGSLDVSGPHELSGTEDWTSISGGPGGALTGGVPAWATDEALARVADGCPGFDPADVTVRFEVQGSSDMLELKSLYHHARRSQDCGDQSGLLAIAALVPPE